MKLKYFSEFVNEELKTKEIDASKFPNPATKNDPSFFDKGKRDGDKLDDVVDARTAGIPAKSLKPSQDAVYLGKALGLAISGVAGGELEAIISQDNRILDGHHRWAATLFNDPYAKIIGTKAEMIIGDLVPVLRQAGDALGNDRGTMPEGGDINIFHATMKDIEDCVYRGINMDPKFFNRDKAIAWYTKNKSSIEKGLKLIQRYSPPAGAPPRQDMPKIKPSQVDKVANDLSSGKIDTRAPYVKEDSSLKHIPSYENYLTESYANMLKSTATVLMSDPKIRAAARSLVDELIGKGIDYATSRADKSLGVQTGSTFNHTGEFDDYGKEEISSAEDSADFISTYMTKSIAKEANPDIPEKSLRDILSDLKDYFKRKLS
jgi:hypothetical protein